MDQQRLSRPGAFAVLALCGAVFLLGDNNATLNPLGGPTNIVHDWRAVGVAVSIPSIAPQSIQPVTVSVPGVQPGDNIDISLAAGSTAPPTGVFPAVEFCPTAGSITIKYGYLAGALTANSAATNITANFSIRSAQ